MVMSDATSHWIGRGSSTQWPSRLSWRMVRLSDQARRESWEISQARWRLSPAQGRYGPGSALRLADSRARVVVTDIDGAKKTADLIVNGGGTAASPG